MLADDLALTPSNAGGPLFSLNVTPIPTAKGCVCSSPCGTSVDDFFSCDWCWTRGRCGRGWSWAEWDYCVYPRPEHYEAQAHGRKLRQLWSEITAAGSVGRSAQARTSWNLGKSVMSRSMQGVFDTEWDVRPHDEGKDIHSQGAHCLFRLDIESNSPYDGLLRPGRREGILRMSNGVNMDWGLIPGLALKFLRSGWRSGNVMALRAAGVSFNFFNSTFSSHVRLSASLPLQGLKFASASSCTGMLGFSELCSRDEHGRAAAANFTFPYQLLFAPSGALTFPEEAVNDTGLLDQLTSIPSGSHLLDLYALEHSGSSVAYLGKLSTRSACVRSLFGDHRLLFRHQRVEEDFALRPEWMQLARASGACSFPSKRAARFKCRGVP